MASSWCWRARQHGPTRQHLDDALARHQDVVTTDRVDARGQVHEALGGGRLEDEGDAMTGRDDAAALRLEIGHGRLRTTGERAAHVVAAKTGLRGSHPVRHERQPSIPRRRRQPAALRRHFTTQRTRRPNDLPSFSSRTLSSSPNTVPTLLRAAPFAHVTVPSVIA